MFFICILGGCENSVLQKEDTSLQSSSTEQNQQLESANQNQPKSDPELTVKMERVSWSGKPMYKVEIQPDGKVAFEGTEYTKTKGRAESKLEKEKMEQLLTEIETSDFFSLDSAYGYRFKNCASALTHYDWVKIHIKLNGQEKTINHDLGCFDISYAELYREINRNDRIFPQKLYKLENKIDEIAETKRWIGEQKWARYGL